MKKALVLSALTLTFASMMARKANAELSIVTMSLTGTSTSISRFEPADTFVSGGILVRTTDGKNECLLSGKMLRASNASGVEFAKYLKELHASPKRHLLSYYTQGNEVIQAVITEAKTL